MCSLGSNFWLYIQIRDVTRVLRRSDKSVLNFYLLVSVVPKVCGDYSAYTETNIFIFSHGV